MLRLTVCCLVLSASVASAQPRGVALSGSNGVLLPAAAFAPASVYTGAIEIALSPKVGVRPSLFWAETDLDDHTASLRRVGFGWDVTVRWDRGNWSPFVATGVSMQLFRSKVNGRTVDEDELNFGASFGGGVDLWLAKHTAITFEASYVLVERGRLLQSPSAGALRGGLKQTF